MIVSYKNYLLARDVFEEYRIKPLSRHIATLSALACLAQTVSYTRPKSVVEIGAGIGTITALLKRHDWRPLFLCAYEDSELCLPQIRGLLPNDGAWDLIETREALEGKRADLLIIDASVFFEALATAGEGTVVFFEGNRGPERELTIDYLREKGFRLTLEEHKLEMRGEPVPGKGCWIGRCERLQ